MELTCYRDREIYRETRHLPAATYNLALTLLARSSNDCLFVPIRSMQYLAILDRDEFAFVDGERKCWIDIAWCNFRPGERHSLEEPVAYEAVYYRPESGSLMARLQTEFHRALQQLDARRQPTGPARVLKFPAPGA